MFSSSVDGSVRVWDVELGVVRRVLVGHTGLVGRMKVFFCFVLFFFLFFYSFFFIFFFFFSFF